MNSNIKAQHTPYTFSTSMNSFKQDLFQSLSLICPRCSSAGTHAEMPLLYFLHPTLPHIFTSLLPALPLFLSSPPLFSLPHPLGVSLWSHDSSSHMETFAPRMWGSIDMLHPQEWEMRSVFLPLFQIFLFFHGRSSLWTFYIVLISRKTCTAIKTNDSKDCPLLAHLLSNLE